MPAKSIYEQFDRDAWRALAAKTPMPLIEADLRSLAALGDPIDLEEADAVYRPLSALLRYRVLHSRALAQDQQDFFGRPKRGKFPSLLGLPVRWRSENQPLPASCKICLAAGQKPRESR